MKIAHYHYYERELFNL